MHGEVLYIRVMLPLQGVGPPEERIAFTYIYKYTYRYIVIEGAYITLRTPYGLKGDMAPILAVMALKDTTPSFKATWLSIELYRGT
jgi:hypothetical protein